MYHIIDFLSICNVLMCNINILTISKDTHICDIVKIVIRLEFSGKQKREYSLVSFNYRVFYKFGAKDFET